MDSGLPYVSLFDGDRLNRVGQFNSFLVIRRNYQSILTILQKTLRRVAKQPLFIRSPNQWFEWGLEEERF